MKIKEFLSAITLESGHISTTKAAIEIGKMGSDEFSELCLEMQKKDVPRVTVIKIESFISGRLEISFDNPDVFEKAKNQFLEVLKNVQ